MQRVVVLFVINVHLARWPHPLLLDCRERDTAVQIFGIIYVANLECGGRRFHEITEEINQTAAACPGQDVTAGLKDGNKID